MQQIRQQHIRSLVAGGISVIRPSAPTQICFRCAALSKTNRLARPSDRSFSSSIRQQQSERTTRAPIKESIIPQTFYEYFSQTLGADAVPPKGPFAIDLRALKKEFLQLQAKAHPDTAPADKKRQAEALSARINEAYKTLQNPLHRAQYLLKLRGIDVAEDETASVDDPELLMEVLETRETIEEAQSESDLLPLTEVNDKRIQSSVSVLDQAFKADDMDLAKAESIKLRYWVNIKESIDGWEKGKPVVLVH